jgi:hypothetical protein
MNFTMHAVEQYISRCRPGLSYPAALSELQAHVGSARSSRERTPVGDHVRVVEELNCKLVTKRERGKIVVVTVLKGDAPAASVTLPTAHTDPDQPRRDALYDLRRYLDRQTKRGDREAERIGYALRNTGVL